MRAQLRFEKPSQLFAKAFDILDDLIETCKEERVNIVVSWDHKKKELVFERQKEEKTQEWEEETQEA